MSSKFLTLVALASSVFAQLEFHPPSAGPWFDSYSLGAENDFGKNNTEGVLDDLIASIVDLTDIFALAEQRMASPIYGRVAGGILHEETKRWNGEVYKHVTLRPRVLVNVSSVSTAFELTLKNGAGDEFNYTATSPIFFAPSGSHGRVHPDAEYATIGASAQAGVIAAISNFSTIPHAALGAAKADNQSLWFQLYPGVDTQQGWLDKINYAEDNGFTAAVIVTDVPTDPLESRNVRAGGDPDSRTHPEVRFPNVITWDDVAFLVKNAHLPIIIKGIGRYEDAVKAKEIGAAAAYLSNHGNRAGDGVNAPLETLLEIRKNAPELFDELPIFLDGNIYSGTNALKALALGAKMVGVGRPVQFGLTLGQAGVKTMIDILNYELAIQMQMIGVNSPSELSPDYVNTLRLDPYISN